MFGLSKRWETALLLSSGIIVVYCLRVNMSVAAPEIRKDLHWSEDQKGYLLSSFYVGYAIGGIPCSFLARYYGPKLLFGLSVLLPSLLTLFVPIACRTSFALAVICRCLLGLFESATFPALFQFYPVWIPLIEKQLIISVIFSGVYLVKYMYPNNIYI